MKNTIFICPVRGCHQPLRREAKSAVCTRGHLFDFSRSGYLNLLQPQDRRAKDPGDPATVVAARRRLHDAGVSEPHLQKISELIDLKPGDRLLEVGCGDGFYVGRLSEQNDGIQGCGVDISVPAVDAASKRYPQCEWIVANADRFIPLADESCSTILSVTARMNKVEFYRLIKPGGQLVLALPSEEDLIELRGTGRNRSLKMAASIADTFQFLESHRISHSVPLQAPLVQDALVAIYRPRQSGAIRSMTLTFSLDVLLFRRK